METVASSEHSNVNEALEHLKSVLVKGETLDAAGSPLCHLNLHGRPA